MHADQLRMAVTKIIDTFIRSDIKNLVDQYRVANDAQRTAAAARVGNAGATIVGRFDEMSELEQRVVKGLHLDTLGRTDYWRALINPDTDPKVTRAELVKLQSRVIFATSHLPGMIGLLATAKTPSDDHPYSRHAVAAGEARLIVRLTDASVAAADPDRIARAVDGIDMLYSACASIVRKNAIDLRLDALDGVDPKRDLHFTGDMDCIASVITILDSIPAALAGIEPGQDVDVDSLVQGLPVFTELDSIASQGAFSLTDMKDIRDSVQQGALLSLESGAILLDPPEHNNASAAPSADMNVGDEHYERYLREREAMQHGSAEVTDGNAADAAANGELSSDQPEVKDLLKSLLKERNQ